jgi:hypothetical protein
MSSRNASRSRRLTASYARRANSTVSCDIARPVSPGGRVHCQSRAAEDRPRRLAAKKTLCRFDPLDGVRGVKSRHLNLRRLVVAEQNEAKRGWVERRREKTRLERERTGDSPERIAERRKGERDDPTPGENADRTAWGNFLSGGGGS